MAFVGPRRALLKGRVSRFVGALDGYTNIFMARSLRRLLSTYNGPLIRVRRSSDNAEQDIGFAADGWLNQAALLAFCGAGNGFVVTWYDQGSGSRDALNLTTTQQPRVVNAGVVDVVGIRAALRLDGVDDVLSGASTTWSAADLTLSEVALIPTTTGKTQNVFSMGAAATTGINVSLNMNATVNDWTANGALAYGNGFNSGRAPRITLTAPGFNDNALHTHAVKLRAAGPSWSIDGGAAIAPAVAVAGSPPTLTATFSLDAARSGYALEKIMFAADQDVTALVANQKAAYSIP